jgi:chromosomal replication initiator protein
MPEHATETWERCRRRIRRKLPQQSYRTWIEPIEALAVNQHPDEVELRLGLPSNFHLTWLQQNFAGKVEEAVREVAGDVAVRYEVTGTDTYQTDMFDPEHQGLPAKR